MNQYIMYIINKQKIMDKFNFTFISSGGIMNKDINDFELYIKELDYTIYKYKVLYIVLIVNIHYF